MDAKCLEETADVIPDRLAAQVQLRGDLLRRAALLQKSKHLDLTWSEMRGWRCGAVVGASFDQPEDTDYRFTALEGGTALTSTGTLVPAVETKTPVTSVATEVPSIF